MRLYATQKVVEGKEEPGHAGQNSGDQKSTVQPLNRRPVSHPNRTTSPEPMPIRLIRTWISVKVFNVKIMIRLPQKQIVFTFAAKFNQRRKRLISAPAQTRTARPQRIHNLLLVHPLF